MLISNPKAQSKEELTAIKITYDPRTYQYQCKGNTFNTAQSLIDSLKALGLKVFTPARDAQIAAQGAKLPENPDFKKIGSNKIRTVGTSFETAEALYDKIWTNYRKELHNNPELAQMLTEPLPHWREIQSSSCGLNILIDYLHGNGKSPDVHCFECKSLDQMKDVLKLIEKSNFQGKIGLLVRSARFENDDTDPMHVHLTPVLIEKRGSKMDVFVADSIGSEERRNAAGRVVKPKIFGQRDSNYEILTTKA